MIIENARRLLICALVDSHLAGRDAGEVLDAIPVGIPIVRSLEAALGDLLEHIPKRGYEAEEAEDVGEDPGRVRHDHAPRLARFEVHVVEPRAPHGDQDGRLSRKREQDLSIEPIIYENTHSGKPIGQQAGLAGQPRLEEREVMARRRVGGQQKDR